MILRWDGQRWSAEGSGVGYVLTFTVYDDGTGPALYAGTDAGVYRWDGQQWRRVGDWTGVTYCLLGYDDGSGPALYAASPDFNMIRWNGREWSPVGELSANALAIWDDGAGPALYAGWGGVWKWNGASFDSAVWDKGSRVWTTNADLTLLRPKLEEQLAEKTGFSTAVLSQVENRMTSPPLGMLVKIANVFDTSVSALIGGREEAAFSIVRKADRRTVSRVELKGGGKAEYSYEALGTGKAGHRMEPFLVTLSPISDANVPRSVHDGEEFLFIMSGTAELLLDEEAGPGLRRWRSTARRPTSSRCRPRRSSP